MTTVSRIALVKPEKARGVEDVILRAAQMGQVAEKVWWNKVFWMETIHVSYRKFLERLAEKSNSNFGSYSW